MNGTESVIPGLTRNPIEGSAEPVEHLWIPAFAGMTGAGLNRVRPYSYR